MKFDLVYPTGVGRVVLQRIMERCCATPASDSSLTVRSAVAIRRVRREMSEKYAQEMC